ncbi:flap endonuclease GEN [Sitophilus oryzae]|uniref:Flap endonuclease GEN n=1 Tax=Sitophilus oryzae TaxID=7048 RepID=A0A6J2YZD5_SITOR|nr:flap endonuclease GEN [Sitophilus oryzae]XP_030768185.1 flap endonuclease GEN [Sitophilus oryzae]
MGIKNLWTVLAPYCDRKPLYELQGKTVAVDLSCWICEAQNITEYQVQPRMYLRNLYFRACYLLLIDVNPVFVLEGKAPELKYGTISARNNIQFKGAKPKTNGVKTGKGRTRFNFVLQQCEEMLRCMGVKCVKGKGEAESLCAVLNEDGLVDGCISQDSDCFAYGAQVVYRNFSISSQGSYSASGGSVDIYDLQKVCQNINFGRNKIIVMALLLGCDYADGVHGVGKDSVMKLFENIPDKDILNRIKSWRDNRDLYNQYESQVNDKSLCTTCGHTGKKYYHTKNGCSLCRTTKGCNSLDSNSERLMLKYELNVRSKALEDPNFPNEELINEFLTRKDDVTELNTKWNRPDVAKFVKFASKFLQWEEHYAFDKIFPMLTRWQCKNPEYVKSLSDFKGIVTPDKIKKIRNPRGIPSYEIIWVDTTDSFKNLIPEEQKTECDLEKLFVTIEPQVLVNVAYPDLVEAFNLSKIKPPKKPSKRKKRQIDELAENLANTSITEVTTTKVKPKPRKTQKTLKNLLNKKEIIKKSVAKDDVALSSSTPCKIINKNTSFNFDVSRFGDESDLDVSGIIEEIVSKKTVANELRNIADEYIRSCNKQEDNSDEKLDNFNEFDVECDTKDNQIHCSSFFITEQENEDLFEKTFNEKYCISLSDSSSETEEYELNECI